MPIDDMQETDEHAPIEELRAAQIAAVNAWYAGEIMVPNGVVFNGAIYQSDPSSWDTLSKTIAAGKLPTDFYWMDSSNNKVLLTFTELQDLCAIMLQARFGVYEKLQKRKSDILATTTEDEIKALVLRQMTEKGNA